VPADGPEAPALAPPPPVPAAVLGAAAGPLALPATEPLEPPVAGVLLLGASPPEQATVAASAPNPSSI